MTEETQFCRTINGVDLCTYGVPAMIFAKDHERTVYLNEKDNDKIVSCMFQSIWGNAFNKCSPIYAKTKK